MCKISKNILECNFFCIFALWQINKKKKMNKIIIEYLKKQGFIVFEINNKALGYKYKENVYNAICKDYRRFLFLEWMVDANYPSIKIFVCDNNSTEESRRFIGYPNVMKLDDFRKEFQKCYVKHYGYIRWIFRPILNPFFKFLCVRETQYGT